MIDSHLTPEDFDDDYEDIEECPLCPENEQHICKHSLSEIRDYYDECDKDAEAEQRLFEIERDFNTEDKNSEVPF